METIPLGGTAVAADSRARSNSFTALRLLAAVFVVVGHCYVLTGHGPAPKLGGLPVHALGVDVFFVLSGYLISESWTRDPVVHRYLTRRVLRIMPALAVVVFITTFVVGPALSALPPALYFRNAETWSYLWNLSLLGTYALPGVFASGHWTTAVNGSFWTLGLEFSCYALLATARWLPRRSPLPVVLLLATAGLAGVILYGTDTGLGAAGRVGLYFALGSLARLTVPTRAFSLRWAVPVLFAWLLMGAATPIVASQIAWLAAPYLALTFGLARPPAVVSWLTERADVSYGLYLWSFLVEQVAISRFGPVQPLLMTGIVLGISVPLALLSWLHIEAPALRLKPHRDHNSRTVHGDGPTAAIPILSA